MNIFWQIAADAARRSSYCPNMGQWKLLWPSFAGSPLDKWTIPRFITARVLYIELKNASYRGLFDLRRAEIEEIIQAFHWGVNSIALYEPENHFLQSREKNQGTLPPPATGRRSFVSNFPLHTVEDINPFVDSRCVINPIVSTTEKRHHQFSKRHKVEQPSEDLLTDSEERKLRIHRLTEKTTMLEEIAKLKLDSNKDSD